MRLLQLGSGDEFKLGEFFDKKPPPYAILSHTWGEDGEEVTFQDVLDGTAKEKEGYKKIRHCGDQAKRDGLEFFWVDSCCIDRSSSAELSEAINSMFRWYRSAAKCYAYLADVSIANPTENQNHSSSDSRCQQNQTIRHSKWFTRSWTLQELLAPRHVEFFSKEWERLGDRITLLEAIHNITMIPPPALRGKPLWMFSVEQRMSWADGRNARREEDTVYSLLGIFNVHIPLIYGEGRKNALSRLRKEINQRRKAKPTTVPVATPTAMPKAKPTATHTPMSAPMSVPTPTPASTCPLSSSNGNSQQLNCFGGVQINNTGSGRVFFGNRCS